MAGKAKSQLEHARKVLVKRAQVAAHQESIKKLRVKMVTAREELKQLRGTR